MGGNIWRNSLLAFVLLAFGLWGAFVTGRSYSGNAQLASLGAKYFPRGTEDGRFGTNCAPNTRVDKPVCGVPFARLIAQPERYQGMLIAVDGYLASGGDQSPSLYPSESSFLNGGAYENIAIGSDVDGYFRTKAKKGIWVQVMGKFDGIYAGQIWSLGIFEGPVEIVPLRNEAPAAPDVILQKPDEPAGNPPQIGVVK